MVFNHDGTPRRVSVVLPGTSARMAHEALLFGNLSGCGVIFMFIFLMFKVPTPLSSHILFLPP